MDTYLNLVSHPFLWIFLGGSLLFFALQSLTASKTGGADGSKAKSKNRPKRNWLSQNYVWLILGTAAVLFGLAARFFLFEIGTTLANLVDLLRDETLAVQENGLGGPAEDDIEPLLDDSQRTVGSSDLRNLAYAVAVLVGVLAASATIAFSVIRVWINERQTRAQETGLITDRINKAVEALGAEKEVTRIGRVVRLVQPEVFEVKLKAGENLEETIHVRFGKDGFGFEVIGKDHWLAVNRDDVLGDIFTVKMWTREDTVVEWQDQSLNDFGEAKVKKMGDWNAIGQSLPNIEVRIGGLLSLELLMKDNPEHYVTIMEILTAYIRENAGGIPKPLPKDRNFAALAEWRETNLRDLRLDVDICLSIIERREVPEQAGDFIPSLERAPLAHLNLSRRNLNGFNLLQANLRGSNLSFTQLKKTNLQSSDLSAASVAYADAGFADLRNAKFTLADMTLTDFPRAKVDYAEFAEATITFSDFSGASLTNIDFVKTTIYHTSFKGADLSHANFEEARDLHTADFQGALLRSIAKEDLEELRAKLGEVFLVGDADLPEGVARPSHWIDNHKLAFSGNIRDARRRAWRDWIVEMQRTRPKEEGWDEVPLPEVDP